MQLKFTKNIWIVNYSTKNKKLVEKILFLETKTNFLETKNLFWETETNFLDTTCFN
jgi:uncharacterized protein YpiB (UPF0302 family)